jgi:lipopolysaccharide transport system ATP-binding protein
MSSDIVIRAENLGKKYVIGHQFTDRATTFREVIARNTHNLARTARDLIHGKPLISGDEVEEFSALQDINFEIHRGDVVGIIGRNGAGKSTLLKVLSRITEPSEGRVEIRGRVASLLEVGTGFHPELTGRENIFLNGAILGMNRSEIRRKFDEIVDFSEVEKFLDTPVKRYSSGMYVRLAFAVAAHLEPEILIVDEVLAVGDSEFQKKCLGKMQNVAGEGRTVLFVSHNLGAIASLCNRGLVLREGRLELDADVSVATTHYAALGTSAVDYIATARAAAQPIHVAAAQVSFVADTLSVNAQISADRERDVIINARVRDAMGVPLGMASLGGFDPGRLVNLAPGMNQLTMNVELPPLADGNYFVDLDIEEPYGHFLDRVNDKLTFEVLRKPSSAHGRVLQAGWGVGPIELAVRNEQVG